jgi:hypothetical protein
MKKLLAIVALTLSTNAHAAWWLTCTENQWLLNQYDKEHYNFVEGTGFGPFDTSDECREQDTYVERVCSKYSYPIWDKSLTPKHIERWKRICAHVKHEDCHCHEGDSI